MILKCTILKVLDTCGVDKVNCFHIYNKKKKFFGKFGNFIKVSIRKVFRKRFKIKKNKTKAIIVNTCRYFRKPDGCLIFLKQNNCVLLKKRLTPYGKYTAGLIYYNMKRKKFIKSFIRILLCLTYIISRKK